MLFFLGDTPLMLAVRNCSAPTVDWFLQHPKFRGIQETNLCGNLGFGWWQGVMP